MKYLSLRRELFSKMNCNDSQPYLSIELIDIIFAIAITSGKTYKTILLVSSRYYKLHNSVGTKNKYCNHLLTLLELYPKGNWNWGDLSQNICVTKGYIDSHCYPAVELTSTLQKPWDRDRVCRNPNITYTSLKTNEDKDRFFKRGCNPNVTIDDIIAHTTGEEPFQLGAIEWENICKQQNITFDLVEKYPQYGWKYAGCYSGFAVNPSVPLSIVEDRPEIWNMGMLSKNPAINIEFVKTHLDYDWDWDELSRNPGIIGTDIDANPNFDWNWDFVPDNPSLTLDWIMLNKHKFYYEDIGLAWDSISAHPSVTMDYVENNLHLMWQSGLSCNPNLTCDFVVKYKDYFDLRFDYISANTFGKTMQIASTAS